MNTWMILGIVLIAAGLISLIVFQILFSKKMKSILKE